MSEAISDFMVHVNEKLNAQQLRQLEDSVRRDKCVISASVPAHTPHLMMVVYDSECTHAKNILEHVRDVGLRASML